MGYKKLKDGRICVTARIRVNGKITQKKTTGNYTIQQAKALIERYKKELRDSGSLKAKNRISTFSECLEVYNEKKNKTSKPDISRINKLKKDLGNIPLNVFPDKFEKYLNLIKRDITVRGKHYSGASINRIIEIVKACFTLCYDLELISENLNSKRFPKSKEKPRDRYLSQDEKLRLFNAISIQAAYLLPFIRYNMLVPCRKSELLNLPKENYNAITKTIYVPDSKAGIPIHKPVPKEMIGYFEKIPSKCPYLFYRETKSGYRPLGDFRKSWRSSLKLAGIKDCRVHDLRHVAASDLYAAGNSERKIMDIAGWLTPMLSTYRHKDSLKSAQSIVFDGDLKGKRENKCETLEAFG